MSRRAHAHILTHHAHSISNLAHLGASGLGIGLGGTEQTKDFPAIVVHAGQSRDHLPGDADRAQVIGMTELPSPAGVEDLADLLVAAPVGLLAVHAAVGGGLASCERKQWRGGNREGESGLSSSHHPSCSAE